MGISKSVQIGLALILASATPLLAHGPTPQKVDEKIDIAAPAADVWKLLKDFGAIATWHPGVANAKGEGGNAAGGQRTITLKSGGDLVEGIDDVDDKAMSLGYRLQTENLDSFPVSFYSDVITVVPAGSGSTVEWGSRFYRADTTNEPPENKNDEAAVKATTDFIRAGLSGLKAKLEGKG